MRAEDARAPLPLTTLDQLIARRVAAVDPEALTAVAPIVNDVRRDGMAALRRHALALNEVAAEDDLLLEPCVLREALAALDPSERERLERIAARIRWFALAQRGALQPLDVAIPGGRAGHTLEPVASVGCYAPGGRHPLPSSVLMTALVARAAGVSRVVVASPRPTRITLAAAALAGADAFLAAGGAQAIAALAYGVPPLHACDLVCGPGSRFVTAAKYLVSKDVAIDLLAGPSELLVVFDASADPQLVAADLIAQAEHDVDALPMAIVVGATDVTHQLLGSLHDALVEQLDDLPTAETARAALRRGGALVADDLDGAVAIADRLAPEHLALHLADATAAQARFRHGGAVFVGTGSGEVLGDYGAGPNHTLPTGGTARSRAGLSVFTFLRPRTWLRIDDARLACHAIEDAAWLARAEGLEGHARSASRRLPCEPSEER
jgi:phosphoribosyl-ATP pyrophosphohydrolase/phosphoribosyl-AMP cyclohydrolase/histidinol dehydrogenase